MQLSEPTSLVLNLRMKLQNALGFHSFDEVTLESVNRKKERAEPASTQKKQSVSLPRPKKTL